MAEHDMNNRYWVCDSLESYDGGTGWDSEYFGPYATTELAQAKADTIVAEGYTPSGGDRPERRVVEVIEALSDVDSETGGPGTYTILSAWRSDENGN